MTVAEPAKVVSTETFPILDYPYMFDNVSPITEAQAKALIRIGWRFRIFRR